MILVGKIIRQFVLLGFVVLGGGSTVALAAPLAVKLPDLSLEKPPVIQIQEVDDRPLLMRLFGMKREKPGTVKIIQVPEQKTVPKRKKVPAVVIGPKNPDAKSVLVIGDAMADGLAKTLDIVFADTPTVKLENKAKADSGVIPTDAMDWNAQLSARLSDAAPLDAIVVMLGNSDRRAQAVDGIDAEFRSERWETVYRARVRALMNMARDHSKPMFWVGMVPVADPGANDAVAYLDEIFRQEAHDSQVEFIDLWSVFADEAGGFSFEGPDIGGQVRQLRLKDGVGFTKSGKRKLAFYVEQEIRGLLTVSPAGPELPAQKVEDGLILSLNDPEAGPDDDLIGPVGSADPKEGSALYQLVVLGKPLLPLAGRVDDLSSQ